MRIMQQDKYKKHIREYEQTYQNKGERGLDRKTGSQGFQT